MIRAFADCRIAAAAPLPPDAKSTLNAAVAALVTEAEKAVALVDSFAEGLLTTGGQPPLATTVGNLPCNFASAIDAALSYTELLRATAGRGQAKSPMDGSFALFEQCLPGASAIEGGHDPRQGTTDSAMDRPRLPCRTQRKDPGQARRPKPCANLRKSNPTDEQLKASQRCTLALRLRDRPALERRERHADPVWLTLLRDQLAKFEIDDPQGQASLSMFGYSMGALVRGVALLRAKREMGALPADCDPYRYLSGIITNAESRGVLESTAHHIPEPRQRAGDLHLQPLVTSADAIPPVSGR